MLRSEDPRFLRGEGRYIANRLPEGALRAVVVRSMMAHARLNGVDTSAAASMPGVAAIRTAADLAGLAPIPPSGSVDDAYAMPLLGGDRVLAAGGMGPLMHGVPQAMVAPPPHPDHPPFPTLLRDRRDPRQGAQGVIVPGLQDVAGFGEQRGEDDPADSWQRA